MCEDPAADPNNPNLYSYCGNNPVNRIDPTGMYYDSDGNYHYEDTLKPGEKPYYSEPAPRSGGGSSGSSNKPRIPEFEIPDIPHFKEPKLPESPPETKYHDDGSITQTWTNSDGTTIVVKFNKKGDVTAYYTKLGEAITSNIVINYYRDGSVKSITTHNPYNNDGSDKATVTHFNKDGTISRHLDINSITGFTSYNYVYKEGKQYYYKVSMDMKGNIVEKKTNSPYTNYSVSISYFLGLQAGLICEESGKNHFYFGVTAGISPILSGSITTGKDAKSGVYGGILASAPSFSTASYSWDFNRNVSSEGGVGVPGLSGSVIVVF